jgi:hypothetical protein
MEKYCISIDWLQVCCYCNHLSEFEYKGSLCTYNVEIQPVETAMFKKLYSVKRNGLEVATIQCEPRPKSLNPKLLLLKLSNRVLYSDKYIYMLYDMISTFGLIYKGITRLDLCYDCNFFNGHKSPSKFIQDFVFKEVGKNGYIFRKGSSKFTCHGSKTSTSSSKITSIAFGSNNNKVRQYIYDKTIELQEVKDKPWIREYWELNGLVNDEKNHVWRTEISIKSQGMDILNMSTGELFKLSPKYLEHYNKICDLFFFYADKYMQFFVCRGQKRTRDYPLLHLFEYSKDRITCKPYTINLFHDTGRMEKICVNKLEQLQETYIDLAEQQRYGLQTATEFLKTLSGIKADKIRLQKENAYLNNLRGQKFLSDETKSYLSVLDECYQNKRDIASDYLYAEYEKSIQQHAYS